MFVKTFDLKTDDKIRLTLPDGYQVAGKVISADHWGNRDGWYIEIRKDLLTEKNRASNFIQSDYGYWKEGCDGGRVEKL